MKLTHTKYDKENEIFIKVFAKLKKILTTGRLTAIMFELFYSIVLGGSVKRPYLAVDRDPANFC